jgi:predicted MFS family arabinose efflux permease
VGHVQAIRRRAAQTATPLRGNPAFRRYFAGRVLSICGSTISPVAYAFAVLHIGGGTTGLGVVLAAAMVPQIVLLLVGGVIADRLPRARVLVASQAVAGIAQLGAAALVLGGRAQVWQLAVLAAVGGATTAFFTPAAQGVVPQIVAGEALREANALLRLVMNIAKVAGPAVGGVVVASAGPGWAIAWDGATFMASAAVLATLRVPLERSTRSRFLKDLRVGWWEFWSRPWLWIMVVQGAVGVLCWLVGFQLLGPVYASQRLGGAASWGLIASGLAAGLLGGSAVALLWRPRRVGPVVCAGIGSMALPLAAMASGAPWPLIAAAAAVTGVGLDVSIVSWSTLMQQRIPPDRLSRVTSYNTLGQILFVPVGYAVAGPVSEAAGVAVTLIACAGAIVVAAVAPLAVREIRLLAVPARAMRRPAEVPVAAGRQAPALAGRSV